MYAWIMIIMHIIIQDNHKKDNYIFKLYKDLIKKSRYLMKMKTKYKVFALLRKVYLCSSDITIPTIDHTFASLCRG